MAASAAARPAIWNDPRVRALVVQILVIVAVVAVGVALVHNTLANLARQGIATGFGYLDREAAFEIGEHLIPYSAADSYGRALLVGLINTIALSAVGIVLATVLGVVVGVAQLSRNWLIRKICEVYVEIVRNVPVLLQLYIWASLLRNAAPGPRQAWELFPGVYLSNRGLVFPVPVAAPIHFWMALALLAGIVGIGFLVPWARRRRDATGQQFPTLSASLGLIIGFPLVVFLIGGAPSVLDVPALKGFNFSGGYAVTPEFTAMLLGLVVYTAAFIAEIVRSGIQAVAHGQSEAAAALGLSRGRALRLVIMPQALRVIIPPLISEFLSLTKNSSLAIAIGFPDLMSITNTTLNQTGQAVEAIAIMMGIYLALSLTTSFTMNWYNNRMALVTR